MQLVPLNCSKVATMTFLCGIVTDDDDDDDDDGGESFSQTKMIRIRSSHINNHYDDRFRQRQSRSQENPKVSSNFFLISFANFDHCGNTHQRIGVKSKLEMQTSQRTRASGCEWRNPKRKFETYLALIGPIRCRNEGGSFLELQLSKTIKVVFSLFI